MIQLYKLKKMFLIKPVVKPLLFGCVPAIMLYRVFAFVDYSKLDRIECATWCVLISALWFIVYALLLIFFKEVSIKELKQRLK